VSTITKISILIGLILQIFIFMGFIIYSIQKKINKNSLLSLLVIGLCILSVYIFTIYLFYS